MSSLKNQGVNTKKNNGRNQRRKPYSPPKLMEYGTVEKLTQSGAGTKKDTGGRFRIG